MVVHAGAREDPKGREGLAHLVEHLVGENIPGLTFLQVQKRFETLGGWGSFGTTGYLSSMYTFHFPDEEKSIQEALTLFGQMLLLGRLTHKIEEEKSVILREYHEKYAHSEERAWALQGRPALFADHPRLTSFASAIGVLDEWMQATPEELQAFYDRYYVPRNISLVCIGSMPRETVLQMLQDTPFSTHKLGQRTRIAPAFSPPPPHTHEQVTHLSEFSLLAPSQATLTCEWVIPLHFTIQCVRILCAMLEEIFIEELRYKRSLTYDVRINYEFWQDCYTLSIRVEIPPDALETAKDILWQGLRSICHAQEKFLEARKEKIQCIYRMDYSGYHLLQAAMSDLDAHHRLLSFSEELQHLEQTTFTQIVELAEYLTPERQFRFIMLP